LLRHFATPSLPIGAFLLTAVLSAWTAPAYRWESLKFVGRFVLGLCVFGMAVDMARDRRRVAGLLTAVVLGAGVGMLMGLGEMVAGPALDGVLALFREAPSRVGGQRRLSGTFLYTTIAAMFFEMVVPLAVAVSVTARRRVLRWSSLAVAVIGTVAVGLTFSRAGLLTLGVVLGGMVLGSRLVLRDRTTARMAGVVLGSLALTVGGLLGEPTFRLRFQTEGERGWYGARYVVPAFLDVRAGETASVVVVVQNTGRAPWRAGGERPFALGHRWLSADGQRVELWPPTEVPIPRDVPPGGTLRLRVSVPIRLPPGEYRLAWDVSIPGLFGFRHRGVPEGETVVRVRPGSGPMDFVPLTHRPRDDRPRTPPSVSRLDLWRAARQMWAERPLLGVGPDNFRRLYGRYLGMTAWDERVHANSLYLELLADLGLLGTAAFVGVVGIGVMEWIRAMGRIRRRAVLPTGPWLIGLGGSLLAFLLHGIVDYFLGFTPTYLLFWMVLGLTVGVGRNGFIEGLPMGHGVGEGVAGGDGLQAGPSQGFRHVGVPKDVGQGLGQGLGITDRYGSGRRLQVRDQADGRADGRSGTGGGF